MRRSRLFLGLLVFVALPLAARTPVWILPTAPTSTTPVTVFVSQICAHGLSATVLGSVIRVNIEPDLCPSVPIPIEYSVDLPSLLVPGEYRVNVAYEGSDEILGTTTFIVRDGAPKPFVIHPFAVPANGLGNATVRLYTPSSFCRSNDCKVIRVGGVPVEWFPSAAGISLQVPPHAPGLVDIDIPDGDTVIHSPAALYYFDVNGPPDLSVFERILFPVLSSAPGVGGSQWVTEAVISNPRKWFVWNYNSIFPFVCLAYPCGERLEPESIQRFNGHGYPNGAALLVAREEAGDLAFSLRARDASHDAEGLGTQLPVVREAAMFRGTMTLLNVPLDPRYRAKLRVYASDAGAGSGFGSQVLVTIRPFAGAQHFLGNTMTSTCQGDQCSFLPYYAEFDLAPGTTGELVDLFVDLDPGFLGWAVVTATNNKTQQVTIVTPDGKGGSPCGNRCPYQ